MTSAQDQARADSETGDPVPKKSKAPATRRKLSGVELEGRFDEWRSQRQEARDARTPQEDARRRRILASMAMGAGILALVITSGVTGQRFESTQEQHAQRIEQLQIQLQDAQAEPVAQDLSGQMTTLSEAAADDAQAVAEAQQGFAALHHQASTQPDEGNGAPNKATLQIAEHRRTLEPLFNEDSFLAVEDEAYSWTSTTPFETSTEIDPRFAWYVRYDGTKAAPPQAYAWSVQTVMPDLEAQDAAGVTSKARVIWLCKDTKTGQVLAWANARYDFDGTQGVFDDLEVVVTAAGAEHQQGVTAADPAAQVPEITAPDSGTKDKDADR